MAAELVVVVVVEPPDLTVASLIVRFMCPTGPFTGMMASVSRYLLTHRGEAMVRPSRIRGTGSTRVRVGRPLNRCGGGDAGWCEHRCDRRESTLVLLEPASVDPIPSNRGRRNKHCPSRSFSLARVFEGRWFGAVNGRMVNGAR
jgi:hypothetical protein